MREVWKNIKQYENIYQVSNLGRIRSLDRIVIYLNGKKKFCKGKILKLFKNNKNYFAVNFRGKTFKVARLVAQEFVPNPNNYRCVIHIDGDGYNDCYINLQWAKCRTQTRQENKEKWISKERLYRVWRGIKDRCYDKNNNRYKNYGQLGIKMCNEWLENYQIFKKWAYLNGYDEKAKRGKKTIDRIDVYGNYEPNNCRFVNFKKQANNKKNNTVIQYKNKKMTIAEWSEITKISQGTIRYRIINGWDVEKTLTLKPKIGRNQYQSKKS